jgi:hypothetical protein
VDLRGLNERIRRHVAARQSRLYTRARDPGPPVAITQRDCHPESRDLPNCVKVCVRDPSLALGMTIALWLWETRPCSSQLSGGIWSIRHRFANRIDCIRANPCSSVATPFLNATGGTSLRDRAASTREFYSGFGVGEAVVENSFFSSTIISLIIGLRRCSISARIFSSIFLRS